MSSLKGKPFKLCYKTENKTKHSLILVLFSITKEKKGKKKKYQCISVLGHVHFPCFKDTENQQVECEQQ